MQYVLRTVYGFTENAGSVGRKTEKTGLRGSISVSQSVFTWPFSLGSSKCSQWPGGFGGGQ